jgi:hypothetical protein
MLVQLRLGRFTGRLLPITLAVLTLLVLLAAGLGVGYQTWTHSSWGTGVSAPKAPTTAPAQPVNVQESGAIDRQGGAPAPTSAQTRSGGGADCSRISGPMC